MSIASKLAEVQERIAESAALAGRQKNEVTLVAISKTFGIEPIKSVIDSGQTVFGENRIQESFAKWPELKSEFPTTELHLVGPLQSNKTPEAVKLFDVIHTVDREKIARHLAKEIERQNRSVKLLVQVNTGEEPQKAGIIPTASDSFISFCRNEVGLQIEGLMCIPPFGENPGPHFALLRKIAERNDLQELSMGMSGDYATAIQFGATHVRVGSAIFGARAVAK